ncbi:gluconokinase [Methylocaldum gracile subsp. desertum]|uniref:gluconokinase n=1 Tax=Methylocaldum sp. GT1BW TaxID=3438964 RepID=UPI003D9FC92D
MDRPVAIVVLLGVSGSGKSTIGQRLAERLRWPFFDGDDFHPVQNIEKMARGQPLTDADREPWLDRLAELIETSVATGRSAVIACSALRHSYRKRLARGHREVVFVYLKGSFELIRERLARRQEHFMPLDLLPSQFAALEEPSDAITIDIRQTPEAIVETIVRRLEDRLTGLSAE